MSMEMVPVKKALLFLTVTIMFLASGCSGPASQVVTASPAQFTPIVATPTPSPTGVPTPEPTPVLNLGQIKLADTSSNLRVRSGPGTDYDIVGAIANGVVIEILSEENGWCKITFADLPSAYVSLDFVEKNSGLTLPEEEIYYYLPPETTGTEKRNLPSGAFAVGANVDFEGDGHVDGKAIDTNGDGVADKAEITLKNHLVDIRKYLPSVEIDLIFATDRNFTGQVLYGAAAPLIQYDVIDNLKAAQEKFQKDGYSIKIYDAYRPQSVQYILFDKINNTKYIANPNNASKHNRGAAIDMTLVDSSGNELEMPSPMHTFNETSHRDSKAMSAEARANMEYMAKVMESCGFTIFNYEWWHFNYEDWDDYLATDYDLGSLILIREQ